MLIKLPKYKYKEIVIGGNLDALVYSQTKNIPIIINKINLPHRFEKTNNVKSLEKWYNLFYHLSLSGLNLVGEKAHHIRIRDEEVSVFTRDARVIKFEYEQLIVFDDESINGLANPKKENEDFIVLDWMIARSCETHSYNELLTEDQFVNKIYFYPSERTDGHHPHRKDLVSISFLNKTQLEDFEYSDTYAKFKVLHLLKEKGIRGKKCGGQNHYALNIEVERREIKKTKMNLYDKTEKIEFR